jgi:hypothetical protein
VRIGKVVISLQAEKMLPVQVSEESNETSDGRPAICDPQEARSL